MVEKRILLAAADPQAAEEFREALGKQWVVTAVASGTAALAEMRQQPCHVLAADLDLPELDGAALLQQVRKRYPKTIRFILAPEGERDQVMKRVLGAHQFLAKPLNKATLKSALEQAVAANVWIPSSKIRELAGRIRAFPTVPALYFEVVNLLKSPDATTEEVGELIARDMAMMTKLLQVLNSACRAALPSPLRRSASSASRRSSPWLWRSNS
jgi:DNA-binding NarL/FixJ family response regulator